MKAFIATVLTCICCAAIISGGSYLVFLMWGKTLAALFFCVMSLDCFSMLVFRRNLFTGKKIDK